MHHPAAALSTTCGADGGPLTLSVSSDPFPSHPPYSLRSSRAPTRGTSANQSAFPHRGPSFRFPVRRPARVGLWMVPAIESDSEHDRGASRTPTTARTVARLHRSTPRRPYCPELSRGRARLSLGGPLPCGASQSDWYGTGAGVHAADRHTCDRSQMRLYPDPRGPDTSCRDVVVSRVSARGGPSTSPGIPPLPASSRGPLRLPSREGKPTPPARGAFRPGILREE